MERLVGSADVSAPTLDRMWTLVGLLGDPQDTIPTIHITGTNGKGSTVRAAVEMFTASGLTAGSYTSPHLDAVNDRICVANQPLNDTDFATALSEIAAIERLATDRSGARPSYFEILAAAAYNWFANNAHVNVIEVGMGGRWDATNVVDSQVSVITNIGSDHLEIIGPTLADVALEKAGIISAGSTVVCGEVDPELVQVVTQVAKDGSCEILLAERDYRVEDRFAAVGGQLLDLVTPFGGYSDLFVPLHGAHQAENVVTALTAVEAFFGRSLSDEVVGEAMSALQVPGRFEVLSRSPVVVTDGAHNPLGAQAVAATMTEVFGTESLAERPQALVLGVSRPQEPFEMLTALQAQHYSKVIAANFDWPRSIPAAEIAQVALAAGIEPTTVGQAESVAAGIAQAVDAVGSDGLVLVTGSLYAVSEARAHLRGSKPTPLAL